MQQSLAGEQLDRVPHGYAAHSEALRDAQLRQTRTGRHLSVQDLVPQTIDQETALAYTARVPASLMKEICFHGTADEILDQVAEWRDQGLRYLLVINGSQLNPKLRKGIAATAPYTSVLRGLKKL